MLHTGTPQSWLTLPAMLAPTTLPCVLDIEASGFGRRSDPIGQMADGRRHTAYKVAASFSCSSRHITLPAPLRGRLSANSTTRGAL